MDVIPTTAGKFSVRFLKVWPHTCRQMDNGDPDNGDSDNGDLENGDPDNGNPMYLQILEDFLESLPSCLFLQLYLTLYLLMWRIW